MRFDIRNSPREQRCTHVHHDGYMPTTRCLSRGVAPLAMAVLLASGAGVSRAQTIPPPQTVVDTTPRRSVGLLRPGDVLKIAVFRDKELSGDYPIDARGYVQIPGLGVIQAAGLDPTDITDRLRLALVSGFR